MHVMWCYIWGMSNDDSTGRQWKVEHQLWSLFSHHHHHVAKCLSVYCMLRCVFYVHCWLFGCLHVLQPCLVLYVDRSAYTRLVPAELCYFSQSKTELIQFILPRSAITNVFCLFLPFSPSLLYVHSPPCCLLAASSILGITFLNQDIPSGWVNITFYSIIHLPCCVSVVLCSATVFVSVSTCVGPCLLLHTAVWVNGLYACGVCLSHVCWAFLLPKRWFLWERWLAWVRFVHMHHACPKAVTSSIQAKVMQHGSVQFRLLHVKTCHSNTVLH